MKRDSFLKLLASLPIIHAMDPLSSLEKLSDSFPLTEKMPVLFLGHGSPMNAIKENQFVKGFRESAKSIPHPKAIVCVSAHWYIRGTKVTAMSMPRTIHDFGGFPKALYEQQYPAPGDPKLAAETAQLLTPTHVELDDSWGLDHGAWSVIKHMYPDADIPVIQLSIDYTMSPQQHFELGRRLSALRDKGILIIGSGNMVHNLRMVDFGRINEVGYGFDWAAEAREKMNSYMLDGNFDPLINYHSQGEAFKLAIPTPDHWLPLIYSLSLKGKNDELTLFNDELLAGSLSMTSVRIG